MRKAMVLAIMGLLLLDGTFFEGRCPVCIEEGKKSTVIPGVWNTTLMYCGSGHYDENGQFHPPDDCNTSSATFTCSNGHSFGVKQGPPDVRDFQVVN